MRAVPCAHFGFDSADAGAGELEARGLQDYTVGIRESGNVGNVHVNQLREGGCGKHDIVSSYPTLENCRRDEECLLR